MNEDILHHIWKFRLFDQKNIKTTDGSAVEIIHPGFYNTDAGPDFFNAQIRIDNQRWAGNIEIHTHTSDWDKHGHGTDAAYDNVILHVVYEADKVELREKRTDFPTLELRGKFDEAILHTYHKLLRNRESFPCRALIHHLDLAIVTPWLERNNIERLEERCDKLEKLLNQCGGDWNELMYREVARSYGLQINAIPFAWLAARTPQKLLARYRYDPEVVEALLFGQAGLLPEKPIDEQTAAWIQKYKHLKHKHELTPLSAEVWKFLRLRPPSFPNIRIAQFAALTTQRKNLFSALLLCRDLSEVYTLFDVAPSNYWKDHYMMGKKSHSKLKKPGKISKQVIILNAVIPVLFAYGKERGQSALCQRMLDWLNILPDEKNHITKQFSEAGIPIKNASDSQAIIHLYKNYCLPKKCLHCAIGTQLLKNKEPPL